MKTIRQLTLTVITALFVVTVALLWASASAKASATKPRRLLRSRQEAPTGLKRYAGRIGLPGRFVSSALARIRYRDFW